MTLHILNRENSLLEVFLSEIRNIEIQHDRMRFRRNLERVGEIMAYEISKTFAYAPHTIETPINPIDVQLPHRILSSPPSCGPGCRSTMDSSTTSTGPRTPSYRLAAPITVPKRRWRCVSTPSIPPGSKGRYFSWSTPCWPPVRRWPSPTAN